MSQPKQVRFESAIINILLWVCVAFCLFNALGSRHHHHVDEQQHQQEHEQMKAALNQLIDVLNKLSFTMDSNHCVATHDYLPDGDGGYVHPVYITQRS